MVNHMLRLALLFFLLLLFSVSMFAQSIYRNQPINKKDSLNWKQGLWITFHNADTSNCIIDSGMYINNEKIGLWRYCSCSGTDLLTCGTTNYFADGSSEQGFLSGVLLVSKDSSFIEYTTVRTINDKEIKKKAVVCNKKGDFYECLKFGRDGEQIDRREVKTPGGAIILMYLPDWNVGR